MRRLPFQSLLTFGVVRLVSLSTAWLMFSAGVGAQETKPSQGVWVEPRVSVGMTLSNNAQHLASDAQSEQTLEVRPGVRVQMNTPRVQGYLDYALSGLYYVQDTSGDNVQQSLNASARVDLWQQRAFLDMSGVISDQAVSAFGNGLSDGNRSETSNFRVSPSLRGQLAGWADYDLRYGVQSTRSSVTSRSDSTLQDMGVRLYNTPSGQRLGWSLDATAQASDYTTGRDTRSDSFSAALLYTITPQLLATLSAGVESNDVLSVDRKRYNTSGLDLDWRPSPRARLQVGVDDRYFGHGHRLLYEYRTGLTVWRYSDSRGASNSGAQSSSVSLGSAYDLFDSLFKADFPDDIERAKVVARFLELNNLAADQEVFQSYLTSSATLDRAQSLSVALMGRRSVVTLAVSRSDARRLDALFTLGDDFDTNSRIVQQGWSLNVAHQLTPLTAVSALVNGSKNTGSSGAQTRTKALTLGLSSRLGLHTTGSLQWRRTLQDGTSSSYGETAVSGMLTHRF